MKFVLLHERARLPERKSAGAGAYDLYAPEAGQLRPGAAAKVPLGFAIGIPKHWVGIIEMRSGLAAEYTLIPVGKVIDSDFRGEVCAMVFNAGNRLWEWKAGERIAQMLIVWHYNGAAERVLVLDETERGAGGFGSSGQ